MSTVQSAPRFSCEEAENIVNSLYGIEAQSKPLPSERDQNFLIETDGHPAYVLKIANRTENEEILDFENRALVHVSRADEPARCPTLVLSKADKEIEVTSGPDGFEHFVRMITVLPGVPLGNVKYHSPELLESIGRVLGGLTRALEGFSHPAMHREVIWDLKHAESVIDDYKIHIDEADCHLLINHYLIYFKAQVVPKLKNLRMSVVHNDANDYNLLVKTLPSMEKEISGIVDFGDMVYAYTIGELAVASAYAMMNKDNPLAAASAVVRGFHGVFPLSEKELSVLFPLICIRLCLSVSISACQKKLNPDNPYLTISEKPAWDLLKKLSEVHPGFACYIFRKACGLEPCPQTLPVVGWLKKHRKTFAPVVDADLKNEKVTFFDLSPGSLDFDRPPDAMDLEQMTELLTGLMKKDGSRVGIGRYNESRLVYTSEHFTLDGEARTVHLGIDIFMDAGSPVYVPFDGKVHSFQKNTNPLDYGPTIILEHAVDKGRIRFFTLYGHLTEKSLEGLRAGQVIQKGKRIAWIGENSENGGWVPHLHFQIMTDMIGCEGDFPGVAPPSQWEVWLSLCPDPNLILGIPEAAFPEKTLDPEAIVKIRHEHLSRSMSISYRKPLKMVRGFMQFLYDADGQKYLDAVNNVPHVGHSHPRIVEAVRKQIAVLNTNTRYLHDNLVLYAQRLTETMPDPLKVCFIVGSGSEANDLAIRLAKAHTKKNSDMIVVEGAYHGNLSTLIDLSPYKFKGPGGSGKPDHVHEVPMPDTYRGAYRSGDPEAGKKYALTVGDAVSLIVDRKKSVAAFFCESLLGCGGQIVLPEGYLKAAYDYVRNAGGVCVADEVQVGFGRVGTHFWGFETQNVVPDIVTLGKPIGNGFPLAAVVTTPEIAESFNNGMEYFNTYGGNPVSCAAGLAVLDVIRDENLQENARIVGDYLKKRLQNLKSRHSLIGDVRGLGLFIGVELVRDHDTLEPAAEEATYIVERMKNNGVLLSTDGPLHNVIKIKPPIVFTKENADFLADTLDMILSEGF